MKRSIVVVASLGALGLGCTARAASPTTLATPRPDLGSEGYQPVYWAGPNTICHDTPGGRFCHPAYHRVWVPGHHNWRGFWIPGHWA